jgi:hypothetical protein
VAKWDNVGHGSNSADSAELHTQNRLPPDTVGLRAHSAAHAARSTSHMQECYQMELRCTMTSDDMDSARAGACTGKCCARSLCLYWPYTMAGADTTRASTTVA